MQNMTGHHFTFSEYAASVSQIENPATPCSNQNRSACCGNSIVVFWEILHHWEINSLLSRPQSGFLHVLKLWSLTARLCPEVPTDPVHRSPTPPWGLQDQLNAHYSSARVGESLNSAHAALYSPALLLSESRCWIWATVSNPSPVAVRFKGDASLSNRPSRIRASIPRDLRYGSCSHRAGETLDSVSSI